MTNHWMCVNWLDCLSSQRGCTSFHTGLLRLFPYSLLQCSVLNCGDYGSGNAFLNPVITPWRRPSITAMLFFLATRWLVGWSFYVGLWNLQWEDVLTVSLFLASSWKFFSRVFSSQSASKHSDHTCNNSAPVLFPSEGLTALGTTSLASKTWGERERSWWWWRWWAQSSFPSCSN